jgi:hypothetical protein
MVRSLTLRVTVDSLSCRNDLNQQAVTLRGMIGKFSSAPHQSEVHGPETMRSVAVDESYSIPLGLKTLGNCTDLVKSDDGNRPSQAGLVLLNGFGTKQFLNNRVIAMTLTIGPILLSLTQIRSDGAICCEAWWQP